MNEDIGGSVRLSIDNCQSPSIVKCTEDLLCDDKGHQVMVEGVIVGNVQHSDEGTCEVDGKSKLVSTDAGTDSSFTFEVSPFGGLSKEKISKDCERPSVEVHQVSTVFISHLYLLFHLFFYILVIFLL